MQSTIGYPRHQYEDSTDDPTVGVGGWITLIKQGSRIVVDYSNYYDRAAAPFTYSETYDHRRGRTKTAKLTVFRSDDNFIEPQPDWEVRIYRDKAGADLMFGGVVTKVTSRVVARRDSTFYVRQYDLDLSGFDPLTLQYREAKQYERINVRSGQVIADLLNLYAPWINTASVEISTSPIIKHIKIVRKKVSEVINNIIEATGWTFYIDENGKAYFQDTVNQPCPWALTEGSTAEPFPAFDITTLNIETNTDENFNDITFIGGQVQGAQTVETFTFNGQDGIKPLSAIPYGLNQNILFLDLHDSATIDSTRWLSNDDARKLSQSLGRLQVNSGINATSQLVTTDEFSRLDNVEYRIAELEITSASGEIIVGYSNGGIDTAITNFIHALEFDFTTNSHIYTREGISKVDQGQVVGVGIYSIRIRIKSGGGAIYFIQGGRTGTPAEYGILGSKNWTKIAETFADVTAFMAITYQVRGVIGATTIRQRVSTDINISVVLKAGGKLGLTGTPVVTDTNLLVGTRSSADFETDCFVDVGQDTNPYFSFFTDNIAVGTVVITYYSIDGVLRERVYHDTGKNAVKSRSTLPGDDGTRDLTIQQKDLLLNNQDARNLLLSVLDDGATLRYRGSFITNTDRLYTLPGYLGVGLSDFKPYSGQLLTVYLLTSTPYPLFSEIITRVEGRDVGGNVYEFTVTFGEAQFDLQRLLLRLQRKAVVQIIDDPEPAASPDTEEATTAGMARPSAPTYVSATFDGSGVAISWNSVSGAVKYEVRDNLYRGQGQGGSLIYQQSTATSYSISAANINNIHKKRSFTFYIWSIDGSGRYSKYPLSLTVEDPAPDPQPIRDITNPTGLVIEFRFAPELESDILSTGRKVQVATDRAFSSLVVNANVSKSVESYDTGTLSPSTVYYLRYGLRDDYTDAIGDILYSGIREVKTGVADLTGSSQYLNNTPADNNPVFVSARRIDHTADTGAQSGWWVEINYTYTQGANVATDIDLEFITSTAAISQAVSHGDNEINMPAPNNTALTRYRVLLQGLQLTDHIKVGACAQFSASSGQLANAIQSLLADTVVSTLTTGSDASHTPVVYQGSIIAPSSVTTNKIGPTQVTASRIDINDLFAQNITASGTITGATLQTATSGQRIVENSSGIIGYDSTGAQWFKIPASSNAYVMFGGVTATDYIGPQVGTIFTSATIAIITGAIHAQLLEFGINPTYTQAIIHSSITGGAGTVYQLALWTNGVARLVIGTGASSTGGVMICDSGGTQPTDFGPGTFATKSHIHSGGNFLADNAGGYFITVSGTARGVASSSGSTLQFGDASASTWTAISWYVGNGTASATLSSVGDFNTTRDILSGRDFSTAAGGSYFITISGTERGVASRSGNTLQFGDGSASTWTAIDFFPSTAARFRIVDPGGSTTTSSIYVYYNSVLTQVKFFNDGAGHNILYV